jgi:hypothetical protein
MFLLLQMWSGGWTGRSRLHDAERSRDPGRLRERVAAVSVIASPAALNQDEQECMDHILAVMHTLCEKWGLREGTNLRYEMCLHIHGPKGSQQHMLQRIAPDQWGSWYADLPSTEGA